MRERQHRRSRESERLLREIQEWSSRTGYEPEAVYVQSMKRKWASCAPVRRLYFASELLSEPRGFRDVVIVHELLHLRIRNHGKLFRSLLNSFVPGWEQEIRGRANRICR